MRHDDARGAARPGGNRSDLHVLMGINERDITALISEILKERFGQEYRLRLSEAGDAWTLQEQARARRPDLLIIVLNNIDFLEETPAAPEKRVQMVIGFLKYLKETYGSPVIALAGWPDDPLIGFEAMFAAADAFFRLPFDPQTLVAAVEKCLCNRPRDGI
ncbi:MAG: hypothetical protein ACE141_18070 [Bryobacteraceae bacterium]